MRLKGNCSKCGKECEVFPCCSCDLGDPGEDCTCFDADLCPDCTKPPVLAPGVDIELVGGPYDGRKLEIPDARPRWYMPQTPPNTLTAAEAPGPDDWPMSALVYEWDGVVRERNLYHLVP